MRADHVERDTVQPGAECAVAAEPGNAPPCANEYLLGDIFGIDTSPGERSRQANDSALVPADQLVECLPVARRRSFNEGAVCIHSAGPLASDRRRAGFIPDLFLRQR
jgi:hypothetical protein